MHKLTVAIVDDEPEIADYIGGLLANHYNDYIHVKIFYSGTKVLEFLKTGQCDLLVSDIRMPVTDGFALLEYIVSARLPVEVVFLTAYRDFDYIYQLLQKKTINYLIKTEREIVILDKISNIIKTVIKNRNEKEKLDKIEELFEDVRNLASDVERIQLFDRSNNDFEQPEKHQKAMNQIKTYIRSNIEGDVSLLSLSTHFHYHPSYLSRAFSQAFGQKLSNYILECKITVAKKYLAETDIPVGRIAGKLGYQSSQAFIRSFRREVGISAREWRRLYSNAT